MSTYDTTAEKRTAVRPVYISLGVDAEGCHHVYRTTDETVHVVGRDRGRERVEHIPNRPVDDWMKLVDMNRGWADRHYGRDLFAEVLAPFAEDG